MCVSPLRSFRRRPARRGRPGRWRRVSKARRGRKSRLWGRPTSGGRKPGAPAGVWKRAKRRAKSNGAVSPVSTSTDSSQQSLPFAPFIFVLFWIFDFGAWGEYRSPLSRTRRKDKTVLGRKKIAWWTLKLNVWCVYVWCCCCFSFSKRWRRWTRSVMKLWPRPTKRPSNLPRPNKPSNNSERNLTTRGIELAAVSSKRVGRSQTPKTNAKAQFL